MHMYDLWDNAKSSIYIVTSSHWHEWGMFPGRREGRKDFFSPQGHVFILSHIELSLLMMMTGNMHV